MIIKKKKREWLKKTAQRGLRVLAHIRDWAFIIITFLKLFLKRG
jgi:hypothetical protein